MKKVLVIVYPEYADFQIAHTLFLLKKLGDVKITTASLDGKAVESIGSLKTMVDTSLSEIKLVEYDLILIPGGDGIPQLLEETVMIETLKRAYTSNIPIATICGAAAFLAQAGILKGKRFTCRLETYKTNRKLFEESIYTDAPLEKDQLVITAKPTAFAELAIAVGEMLHLFRNKQQSNALYSFCKGENS